MLVVSRALPPAEAGGNPGLALTAELNIFSLSTPPPTRPHAAAAAAADVFSCPSLLPLLSPPLPLPLPLSSGVPLPFPCTFSRRSVSAAAGVSAGALLRFVALRVFFFWWKNGFRPEKKTAEKRKTFFFFFLRWGFFFIVPKQLPSIRKQTKKRICKPFVALLVSRSSSRTRATDDGGRDHHRRTGKGSSGGYVETDDFSVGSRESSTGPEDRGRHDGRAGRGGRGDRGGGDGGGEKKRRRSRSASSDRYRRHRHRERDERR